MANGELSFKTPTAKQAIDFGGKFLAGLAGFVGADMLLLRDVSVTPSFLLPLAGWIICIGMFIVLWRVVKP